MIHHHGTPITPDEKLLTLSGKHFCVPYSYPRQLQTCLRIGQSVMGDSGAFLSHKNGIAPNWQGYDKWLDGWLRPPHWSVVPDVIGGSVEDQRELHKFWRFPREWGAVVWHLHLPLDWLAELSDHWPFIAFGSSQDYWITSSDKWRRRVDDAWEVLAKRHRYLPRVHMLRAMKQASEGPWPFASADSTNVARNHFKTSDGRERNPNDIASRVDAKNPPALFVPRIQQMEFP